jgi:hypothetical protein
MERTQGRAKDATRVGKGAANVGEGTAWPRRQPWPHIEGRKGRALEWVRVPRPASESTVK